VAALEEIGLDLDRGRDQSSATATATAPLSSTKRAPTQRSRPTRLDKAVLAIPEFVAQFATVYGHFLRLSSFQAFKREERLAHLAQSAAS
jgi:hypothetical protein